MSDSAANRSSDERLSARYPVSIPVQLIWRSAGRWVRRNQSVEIVGELADLSVTGAAVRVPLGGDVDQLELGRRVGLSIDGADGQVHVRHIRETRDHVLLGLEFRQLSPQLQERVYQLVALRRAPEGVDVALWIAAR